MLYIPFVSAPCSSGKTFVLCNKAIGLVTNGKPVVIAVPTLQLQNEIAASIEKMSLEIEVRVIAGEGAIQRTVECLSDWRTACILLITHACLFGLRHPPASKWTLFIDEAPKVHRHVSRMMPHTHERISSFLQCEGNEAGYDLIAADDSDEVKDIARNHMKDDGLEPFRDLASLCLYPNTYDVFMKEGRLENLSAGEPFEMHAILRPDVLERFKITFMFGAFFECSLVKLVWERRYDVKFFEDSDMTRELRFHAHDGRRLTIEYALEKLIWSKEIRNRYPLLAKDVCKAVVSSRQAPFLWMANKDIPDNFFPGTDAARLPSVPHGLNRYQHVDNVVLLAAHNVCPSHQHFLKKIGRLEEADIAKGIAVDIAYQAAMRCSLRDVESVRPVTVVVMDRRMADGLQAFFPGSSVKRLPSIAEPEQRQGGRKREHASDRDRQAACRAKAKAAARSLKETLEKSQRAPESGATGRLVPGAKFRLSVIAHKKASEAEPFDCSVNELEELLKEMSKEAVTDKESCFLISGSFFDPSLGEKKRGADNVVGAVLLMLDFDGGTFTHEHFAALFPRVRMTIYSSYSSTKAVPRFRVVIPLSQMIPATAYKCLFIWINAKIEAFCVEHGKSNGIDLGKSSAANFFYAPGQPDDPGGYIFRVHKTKRALFDVAGWLESLEEAPVETTEVEKEALKNVVAQRPYNETRIEQACEAWRVDGTVPGKGHREFFMLACRVAGAGVAPDGIVEILKGEAASARHPAERVREIPGIMISLNRYGYDIG